MSMTTIKLIKMLNSFHYRGFPINIVIKN